MSHHVNYFYWKRMASRVSGQQKGWILCCTRVGMSIFTESNIVLLICLWWFWHKQLIRLSSDTSGAITTIGFSALMQNALNIFLRRLSPPSWGRTGGIRSIFLNTLRDEHVGIQAAIRLGRHEVSLPSLWLSRNYYTIFGRGLSWNVLPPALLQVFSRNVVYTTLISG